MRDDVGRLRMDPVPGALAEAVRETVERRVGDLADEVKFSFSRRASALAPVPSPSMTPVTARCCAGSNFLLPAWMLAAVNTSWSLHALSNASASALVSDLDESRQQWKRQKQPPALVPSKIAGRWPWADARNVRQQN